MAMLLLLKYNAVKLVSCANSGGMMAMLLLLKYNAVKLVSCAISAGMMSIQLLSKSSMKKRLFQYHQITQIFFLEGDGTEKPQLLLYGKKIYTFFTSTVSSSNNREKRRIDSSDSRTSTTFPICSWVRFRTPIVRATSQETKKRRMMRITKLRMTTT